MKTIIRFWGFVVLVNLYSLAYSQEFITEGITFYNEGNYDALIKLVPEFVQEHPHEEGLARFFLAESYYNKGITESDVDKAINYFQKAWYQFRKAVNSPDLRTQFKEYYYSAKYKTGWCSYRLAELSQNPIEMLQRAHSEFLDIEDVAPDSIKIYSYFMAVECKIRENVSRFNRFLAYGYTNEDLNQILRSYEGADTLLDRVLSFVPSISTQDYLEDLQAAAEIRKEDIKFYLGKIYQVLPYSIFNSVTRPNKKSNPKETALFFFKELQYMSLFDIDIVLKSKLKPILSYLNLINYLNQYFITRDDTSKLGFLKRWSNIKESEFQREKFFRRGNLYQSNPDYESEEFNILAISFYDSAAPPLDESYYWLAYLQMIQNKRDKSKRNFNKFINSSLKNKFISNRKSILLEDAQYRIFLLEFESLIHSKQVKGLGKLAREIARFSPKTSEIRNRKQQLDLLVNCALRTNIHDIWVDVLRGTDKEKLEQALNTIRFILPRADLNIGTIRERYINLLRRLFKLTETRRSDETRFFKGIVQCLEAGIQAEPQEKIKMFKAAAQILGSIDSNFIYKNEADYIQGKCLFFAEEFDQAYEIFKQLINQNKNARALFYLAEIFRLNFQGLAAKACYDVIMTKTKESNENNNNFWYYNARAGKLSSNNTGSLEVLNGVDYRGVEFQTEFGAEHLTYENLVDAKFLKQQYAEESINWLQKYGLPKKEIYPSNNRLKNSLFVHENIFEKFPGVINEIRGPITASLKIFVHTFSDIVSRIEVKLGDEILESQNKVFVKKLIPLNTALELLVRNPDCYLYKQIYKFNKPGLVVKNIVLNKRLAFSESLTGHDNFMEDYPFQLRWDANLILKKDLPKLNRDSELVNDFSNSYELRDCAVDKIGNRLLAVNAVENRIWIYSNDPAGKKVETLRLNYDDSLNSPEGIAVDSEGSIFIADWGNHRILAFNNYGDFVRQIGTFGTNTSVDVGKPIKFVFPTRIAVQEDQDGIQVDEKVWYGEKYLFVADQNGIHVCNMSGDYLGTPMPPNEQLPRGSFYGFIIERYGVDSRLYLMKRQEEFQGQVFEFVAN
ncbi:MAG: SMP-30/gluconolactonase/LRE family protein [bacterium]